MNETIHVAPLCSLEGADACMGIALDGPGRALYLAANGKRVYRYALDTGGAPALVATITEGTGSWSDTYGDVFLHELKLGGDGRLYAAAGRCVLQIDPDTGDYRTLVEGGFRGGWGAYALSVDGAGNLFVGDHRGGVHQFVREEGWRRHTIVEGRGGGSYGGIELRRDAIWYLDFERSVLVRARCRWRGHLPEVMGTDELETGLEYPEFLQAWAGDLLVKAARGDNVLLRVRDGAVVERIELRCEGAGPIVTFVVDPIDEGRARLYGVSWSGTLYAGELVW